MNERNTKKGGKKNVWDRFWRGSACSVRMCWERGLLKKNLIFFIKI